LAETVRTVSISRITTFKLHLYDADTLALRHHDAIDVFEVVGHGNARRGGDFWSAATSRHGREWTPARQVLRQSVFEEVGFPTQAADALMTSPPYGDNHTTVPYGQHSYLPASWIDRADLVGSVDGALLETPGTLDTASLGGSRRLRFGAVDALSYEYPSVAPLLRELSSSPTLLPKVVSFVDDYASALRVVSRRVRSGGFTFWTLGQRRVDGRQLPLVALTREILESEGSRHVATVERRLRQKRMAAKNRSGQTMETENILVMQNG
jgi:site-specific DNA-methyltransferase (cytosine-N4-specific)